MRSKRPASSGPKPFAKSHPHYRPRDASKDVFRGALRQTKEFAPIPLLVAKAIEQDPVGSAAQIAKRHRVSAETVRAIKDGTHWSTGIQHRGR